MSYFEDPADSGSAAHSWRPGKGEVLPPSQRGRSRFFTRRRFIGLVTGLAILSLVLAIPDVATALLMVTLGLALPLMFAPTALLYLLAGGAPYLYATRGLDALEGAARKRRFAGGIAIAVLSVLFVALAPNLFSAEKARSIEADLTARNLAVNIGGAARSISISGNDRRIWGSYPAIEDRPCDNECRALLLSGAADWIRIVNPATGKAQLPDETTFVAGQGAECAAAEDARTNPIHCVLVAPPRSNAELAIVSEEIPAPREKSKSPLAPHMGGGRQLTARYGGREVFSRLQQTFSAIYAPTLIIPSFRGINSRGFEIVRTQQNLNSAATLEEMFVALGYGAAIKSMDSLQAEKRKFSEPPTAEQINRAISTLALPSNIAFNAVHLRFIEEWVSHIRWRKPVGPDDMPILRKILLDPRVNRVSSLDQVLQRKEVLAALGPELIELLVKRKLSKEMDSVRAASNALLRAKLEDIAPLKERLVQYARQAEQTANPEEFARIAARFDHADQQP